jgi:hypothetical protein
MTDARGGVVVLVGCRSGRGPGTYATRLGKSAWENRNTYPISLNLDARLPTILARI